MFSLFAMGQRALDLITAHQPPMATVTDPCPTHELPAAVEACRPTDYPPYEPVGAEERHEALLFSPWVQRARADDLPVYTTHQSAYAYVTEKRRSAHI